MALAKCKECGSEVSTKAKTCPQCGAPIKKGTSAAGCLFVIIICVLAGVIVASVNSGGTKTRINRPKPPSQKQQQPLFIDLNARVQSMGTQFVISNQDSFNWVNVELQLNPGLFTSEQRR